METGTLIKKFRTDKKLTQKQLGELCIPPIAESTIRRYELGKLNPKFETLQKIAHALDISVYELYAPKSPVIQDFPTSTVNTERFKRLTNYLMLLNESGLEKAEQELETLSKSPVYSKNKS